MNIFPYYPYISTREHVCSLSHTIYNSRHYIFQTLYAHKSYKWVTQPTNKIINKPLPVDMRSVLWDDVYMFLGSKKCRIHHTQCVNE